MRVATSSPRPYLLNQAGGVCPIQEFSLVGDRLVIKPASDKPLTGIYELVYRCPDHQNFDIKRAVSSDGSSWAVLDKLSPDEDCDVCYPGPCD